MELTDRGAPLIPHLFPHSFPHYNDLHGHCSFSAFFSLQSMDEISALKSNDNSWPPKSCVHMITRNPKEGETDTLFVLLLHDREVIWQTCRQPNKNQLTTTEMVLKWFDIIMDLARGIPTTTQQLRNHFLPMGKMLVEQFHFYSGPSSTLRLSS